MAETGDCCAAGGVEKFLAILEEDVTSLSTNGFFGNEARVPVEDCAVGSICVKPVSTSIMKSVECKYQCGPFPAEFMKLTK